MAQATLVRPNPALTRGFAQVRPAIGGGNVMTLQGTVNKTIALTAILLIGGAVGWPASSSVGSAPFFIALIAAAIIGLVTSFKPEVAKTTAPIYALLEGFVLGAISQLFNQSYPGIALTAAELTVGILVAMLAIYRTGIIKVNQRFRIGVAAATFGVLMVFLANAVASLFGGSIGIVSGNGTFAILFSLVVITIACANLIVDFDFIQKGVAAQFPQYMEWYGAFSIMVTLVWLYLEILRLLSKLRSR